MTELLAGGPHEFVAFQRRRDRKRPVAFTDDPGRARLQTDNGTYAMEFHAIRVFPRGKCDRIFDGFAHRELRFRREQDAARAQVPRLGELTEGGTAATDKFNRKTKFKPLRFALLRLHYIEHSNGPRFVGQYRSREEGSIQSWYVPGRTVPEGGIDCGATEDIFSR